jgi:hypothetical protein
VPWSTWWRARRHEISFRQTPSSLNRSKRRLFQAEFVCECESVSDGHVIPGTNARCSSQHRGHRHQRENNMSLLGEESLIMMRLQKDGEPIGNTEGVWANCSSPRVSAVLECVHRRKSAKRDGEVFQLFFQSILTDEERKLRYAHVSTRAIQTWNVLKWFNDFCGLESLSECLFYISQFYSEHSQFRKTRIPSNLRLLRELSCLPSLSDSSVPIHQSSWPPWHSDDSASEFTKRTTPEIDPSFPRASTTDSSRESKLQLRTIQHVRTTWTSEPRRRSMQSKTRRFLLCWLTFPLNILRESKKGIGGLVLVRKTAIADGQAKVTKATRNM